MIIPAMPCHLCQMNVQGLREADRLEVLASAGIEPSEALQVSLQSSSKAWVLLDQGIAVCMWGVVPAVDPRLGVPWLLATPRFDLRHNQKQLLRHTRHYVSEMEEGFVRLFNFTDVRHTQSHRWLRWAGFTLCAPVTYGPEQRPFYPFFKEPACV